MFFYFFLFQVEEMFGERKKLILPILFDIANLVRTASLDRRILKKQDTLYQETEWIPDAQYLKRSLNPSLATNESSSATSSSDSVLITEGTVQESNIQDDRLQIDDDDDAITTIKNISSTPIEQQPLAAELKRDRSLSLDNNNKVLKRYDDRSYHERKLNMTNFNGSSDQFAMESEGVPVTISLPNAFPLNTNLSLEEYEELALRELNDTMLTMGNGKNSTESLPTPEMLIARYRAKNPYRKLQSGFHFNAIDGQRTCERFLTLCLRVEDYPM